MSDDFETGRPAPHLPTDALPDPEPAAPSLPEPDPGIFQPDQPPAAEPNTSATAENKTR
ncbi:hypothetical protein SAMN05421819_4093 [Bryocella elongata]|uniref:Uncharacterized protein n=1 Tax=Bryocella elongata TaxID=863522 RepID=A0A1H6BZD3_9BACT|nr:hypothetical protein [Bryocella elongata]SEG66060.1 hypothetical protein SAMN05421819_4093 [Bryocella elongata]